MLKLSVFPLSILALSVSAGIQAKGVSQPDKTITVVASSKQSQYAVSSQNVASYKVDSYRLEEANVTNTQTLNRVLPGFNFAKSDSSLNPVTSIRGFTSLGGNWYNPAVVLYVDGVPQMPTGFSQPLDNIAHVEVLKGPQATLYGAASEGGMINIITEQPENEYKGYIQGGYASRNGYRGRFNVSGPLAEGILYGSLSGMRNVEHGRLFNPGTGHKNLDGESNNIGSVKLRLAPDNQPFEFGVSYNGQCLDGTTGLMIDPSDANITVSKVTSDDPKGIAPDARDPSVHRCMQTQSVTGQYTTENWLLTLISSWQQNKIDRVMASTGPSKNYGFPERWLSDVQEVRMSTSGKDNVIDGVLGLYRKNTRAWVGLTYLDNKGKRSGYQTQTSMQSVAAYTDLTWHANEKLDFGAGLRFSHDSANTRYANPTDATTYYNGSGSDNRVLGQISAGYQITETNRIYARIAQGYKPMGFDYRPARSFIKAPQAFQPEKSLTYEIGNKYSSENLHLQGAIFHNQVSDTQKYFFEGGPENRRLANAGDSRSFGFELAGSYVFTQGWRIGANVNVIEDKFTGDSKNNNASGQYANKPVPFVPEFSGGIYVSGDIKTRIGTFSPYVGFNYTGAYNFDDKDFFKQPAYSITDISLNWQATDRISISAYINNLFDKRYLMYAQYYPTRPDNSYGYVNSGRTAGIDMKIELF